MPQGSVLGPLLFIIYINDIHCASNKFKSILYDDDTTLVGSLHSFESQTHPNDYTTLSNNINKELSHISEWLNANKLFLNKDKTKYMIHHFSQRDVSQLKITLSLEGKQIQGICEFNFLGTTIQETLKWAPHTDRIANKISRTLGVMNKLKHFLPTYTLRTMYNSLICRIYMLAFYPGDFIRVDSPSYRREPLGLLPSTNIMHTLSPCAVESQPTLATAVVAPLHPALSLPSRLMLLMVAPFAYSLSVSSHLCLGVPLFLDPFILPSITSSSIPPALTTCPK